MYFQTYYLKKKKRAFIILLKNTVNEIKMCNDKKAAITIAAPVTVFFYMSTGGYDSCYPETFHRQLISPFVDLHHTSRFTNFYVNAIIRRFLSRTKPAILSHLHSPSMTSCLISISILKESFSVMFRKQYYISFLYIYMNDTSISRDFFPTCRKKETNLL